MRKPRSITRYSPSLALAALTTVTILALGHVASARAQVAHSHADTTLRAEALNNRGVKLADAGEYAEAVDLFRQAIRLRPDYVIAYSNLGATFYRAEQFAEASAALQKALHLN